MASDAQLWWRSGVIYQVYPRSFQDTTGNGVGDLRGILSRLDYLVELGIDAVWVSPFYPSPMADFGYDVADYTGVDPLFGSMADFDALLEGAHVRGLKLVLDFVPNHTSDQHPWFLESATSRTNPKADWYLWRDAAPDGGAPNNWMASFGGSGWTWVEARKQFYYHSFLPQQPDLNWRNPDVRRAMFTAMKFWLDKSVDGFRMDVLWLLIKDDQFRNNPPDPSYTGGNTAWSVLPKYTANQPETLEIVMQMRALLNQYDQRVLIGEIYLPIPELVRYYGSTPYLIGAQMPFNFHLIQTGWQADLIAELIKQYEAALPAGAWPNWVLGNHDQKRLATRIGADQARVAAVLILTLRGTPTLYNGDELGMPDAVIAPDQMRDPAELRQPGLGLGRDPERSPMLWSNTPNAGFATPETSTWLPLVQGWPGYTVETEEADEHTMLKLYRRLLRMRREQPALHAGTVSAVSADNGVLSYTRSADSEDAAFAVHLNLTDQPQNVPCGYGKIILNSFCDDRDIAVSERLYLRANEGVILQLS